ncbi:MAG: tRNA uridine-5-carboxymethylaminomethyl(34) synthesis GTPase MnmE [Gemmatimonadota bacterium]|nr:tRNA uridine-5-carboxymethylaminomethyl(34) synthesis GTPase MnmE [Gemmatimonadota bacterium]
MTDHAVSKLPGGDDTIAALATAAGRGAVALIRISGADAFAMARKLGAPTEFVPRVATRVTVRHPATAEPLDDALLTHFVGPHSFTGEDVVEISTHGGRVVPASVLVACIAAGARQALPGEFTRRALLNGRIDLLQAEAIADLVDARTGAMQELALAQLDGGLSRRLLALRGEIIALEVLLAYDIDFPEEDDGPIAPARMVAALRGVRQQLESLLATAPRAALVRDGALVVIAGPPNAGKSSLFNALLGEARALVTEIPGTTRDAIEALLDTPGLPLRLVDTAGLRATDDVVERLGIEVSERYVGKAKVILACGESMEAVSTTIKRVRPLTGAKIVAVVTKADVGGAATRRRDGEQLRDVPVAVVSAEAGTGLRELLEMIVVEAMRDGDALGSGGYGNTDDTPITRERHRVAIATALGEIVAFETGWLVDGVPPTVAAVHLHAAAQELAELVGSIGVDDVLDKLFRDFCVGK